MTETTTPQRYPATDGDRGPEGISVRGTAYKDSEQMRFAFVCEFHAFNLPAFDDFIDALPEGAARDELLDWRQQAFAAFKANNRHALKGWMQAVWVNWQTRDILNQLQPTVKLGLDHRKTQAERGKLKLGHEGPLKQIIRDVIGDGVKDFDAMLAALEDNVLVHDVTDALVTYQTPSGAIKDVKLETVERYYRDITK